MELNQVILPSQNIQTDKQFYLSLGFILIVDTPDYLRFACAEDGATFSLHKSTDSSSGTTVYFEDAFIDKTVQGLVEKGIAFDSMPEDKPYLWREAALRDPSGNKLVIYSAGENRLNPPWRVQP